MPEADPAAVQDEPTSGLDARAAAIVMRTVRNTVNTGRTVVCTIHQPSIDIFEVHIVLAEPNFAPLVSEDNPIGPAYADGSVLLNTHI